MRAWRISKTRYHPYDGGGARLVGGRWNSPGREVVYASDSFAGAILEVLVHAGRPRTLPGLHHAVEIEIPDGLIEEADPDPVTGWEQPDSPAARAFGDQWLETGRTAVLSLPSLPARPVGRTLAINPAHRGARQIAVSPPFRLPWDERLF
jgi:RES domain-containing protein